jgi:uncharacterized Rmd1/YagE family protein
MQEQKAKQSPDVLTRVFGSQDQTKMSNESENVSLIIKEWLDPKHAKAKTRYTKKQVVAVSILQSLAETYNIKTLKRFLQEFKIAKLSEDGQSSSELEGILKARLPEEQDIELRKLTKFLE